MTWFTEKRATSTAESYNRLLWNPTAFTTLTGSVLLDFHLVHGNFSLIAESYILWDCFDSFLWYGGGCFTRGAANLGATLNDKQFDAVLAE